jgi:hypothetical protein
MPFINAATAPLVAGADRLPVAITGGKLRVALAEFTYAADVPGTYPVPEIILHSGARVIDVALNTSASTGAASLALGVAGAAGRYRAAAALTATDQWVQANLTAPTGVALTGTEAFLLTTAAANLPASGRLLIRVLWVDNS